MAQDGNFSKSARPFGKAMAESLPHATPIARLLLARPDIYRFRSRWLALGRELTWTAWGMAAISHAFPCARMQAAEPEPETISILANVLCLQVKPGAGHARLTTYRLSAFAFEADGG